MKIYRMFMAIFNAFLAAFYIQTAAIKTGFWQTCFYGFAIVFIGFCFAHINKLTEDEE